MERDVSVSIFSPHYHIKYSGSKCGRLMHKVRNTTVKVWLERRPYYLDGEVYLCKKCGEHVTIISCMSYNENQELKK